MPAQSRVYCLFLLLSLLLTCHSEHGSAVDIIKKILSRRLQKTTPSQIKKIDAVPTTPEIANVTCITEKYGLGYVGHHNEAYDGTSCVNWTENLALYRRYLVRGQKVIKNYCRNPDNDSMGPWCFVQKRSHFKRQFKFKQCNIPLCRDQSKQVLMGVYMMQNRKCPFGFRQHTQKIRLANLDFCVVQQSIIDRLPKGQYSFVLLGNPNTTNCAQGFEKTHSKHNQFWYCTKTDPESNMLDFPDYVFPNKKDLIFMTIVLHKYGCPTMRKRTSYLVLNPKIDMNETRHTTCYYFYKLSDNKKVPDRKLALLTIQKRCPILWSLKTTPYFFQFRNSMFRYKPVQLCVPSRNVNKYPDGDYCLLSIKALSMDYVCPDEFVPVTFRMYKLKYMFCCRQAKKQQFNNRRLFEFSNFTSLLVINSMQGCQMTKGAKMSVEHFSLTIRTVNMKMECENCDLFKSFTLRRGLFNNSNYFSVSACYYEKIKKGFAYASLNTRCPHGMDYSMISYFLSRYSYHRYVMMFCSKVNYPPDIKFPRGRYCIYKIGDTCPPGFQTDKRGLPLKNYRILKTNKEVPNYQLNSYCCRNDSDGNTFQLDGEATINQSRPMLPYVTPNFEFGLPNPDKDLQCTRGLITHSTLHTDSFCEYYPVTDSKSQQWKRVISTLARCKSPMKERGRTSYSINTIFKYCTYFVNDHAPPGNYCAIFQKRCPSSNFEYVTYHPLKSYVICCRNGAQNNDSSNPGTLGDWVSESSQSITLMPGRDGRCAAFANFNLGRPPVPSLTIFEISDIGHLHRNNLTSIGVQIRSRRKRDKLKYLQALIGSCYYERNPYNMSTEWPHGDYGLPKPLSGCAPGFREGYIEHGLETANPSFTHSDVIHLDGDYSIGGSKLRWSFCVRHNNKSRLQKPVRRYPHIGKRKRLKMPWGRYCIFQASTNSRCPYNFRSGFVRFVEVSTLVAPKQFLRNGSLPRIEQDGAFISYHFCCQGPILLNPMPEVREMVLPTETGPFYLLRYGSHCQPVRGMQMSHEFICIDSEDSAQFLNLTFHEPYRVEGATPVSGSYSTGCDFQINLCYYHKDGPKSVINKTEARDLVRWPVGSYAFLRRTADLCPADFDAGQVTIEPSIDSRQSFSPGVVRPQMLGQSGKLISYCKRSQNTTVIIDLPEENWPEGIYCFFFDNLCPSGFLRFSSKMISHSNPVHERGAKMASWNNLCCRHKSKSATSRTTTAIPDVPYFPGDSYSIVLLPYLKKAECPRHRNMMSAMMDLNLEFVCLYERIIKFQWSIPFPAGDYLMPPPFGDSKKTFCSDKSLFEVVTHRHIPAKYSVSTEPVDISFCASKQPATTSSNTNKLIFPQGNYCVLTRQETCPSNQFKYESMLVLPKYIFEDTSLFSHYLVCCQMHNRAISNIAYPELYPMVLYAPTVDRKDSRCSFIDHVPVVRLQHVSSPLLLRWRPPTNEDSPSLVSLYNTDVAAFAVCVYDHKRFSPFDPSCNCHVKAICTWNLNPVRCDCLPGYYGDGHKNCSLVIANVTDGCGNVCNPRNSDCLRNYDTDKYKCVCRNGYMGNGFNCRSSCRTRRCPTFSKCVIENSESSCECRSLTVRFNGPDSICYSDFINTVAHFDMFDFTVSNINYSCFSNSAYKRLQFPTTNNKLLQQTLVQDEQRTSGFRSHLKFLIIIMPSDLKKFVTCEGVNRFYSLEYIPTLHRDVSFQKVIFTEDGVTLLLMKDEKNRWSINENITVLRADIFTNVILLKINTSKLENYTGDFFSRSHRNMHNFHESQNKHNLHKFRSQTVKIGVGLCIVALLVVAMVVGLLLFLKKPHSGFNFDRLRETRSETNIHFAPDDGGRIDMN